MKRNFDECILEIGSITQALKAQDALAFAYIPSKIIKARASRNGCIYAITFPCPEENRVREIISGVGIPTGRRTRGQSL